MRSWTIYRIISAGGKIGILIASLEQPVLLGLPTVSTTVVANCCRQASDLFYPAVVASSRLYVFFTSNFGRDFTFS